MATTTTLNQPFNAVLSQAIVTSDGKPTPYFMRWLLALQGNTGGNSPSSTTNENFINNVTNVINQVGNQTLDIVDASQQIYDLAEKLYGVSATADAAYALAANALSQPTVEPYYPTALVGLTPVNGVATTYIRSDSAPALNQAIAPTWTGIHTFDNTLVLNSTLQDGSASVGTAGQILSSTGTNVEWVAAPVPTLEATYIGYGSSGNVLTGGPQLTYTVPTGDIYDGPTLTLWNNTNSIAITTSSPTYGITNITTTGSLAFNVGPNSFDRQPFQVFASSVQMTAPGGYVMEGGSFNVGATAGATSFSASTQASFTVGTGVGFLYEQYGAFGIINGSSPTNYGTLGQVLTSQGPGASPEWTTISSGGSPGGSSGEIQWNNFGAFDGLPTSTWDGTNLVLSGANEPSTNGGDVTLTGGTNASGGNGGNVHIYSGSGDNNNGYIEISTGGPLYPGVGSVAIGAYGSGVLSLTATNTMQLSIGGSAGTTGQVLGSDGAGNVEWVTLTPAPVYTLSTLPTAVPGFMITVSDANGGAGALCYCIASTWLDAGTHLAPV